MEEKENTEMLTQSGETMCQDQDESSAAQQSETTEEAPMVSSEETTEEIPTVSSEETEPLTVDVSSKEEEKEEEEANVLREQPTMRDAIEHHEIVHHNKEKKQFSPIKWIATALICSLFGGIIGSGITIFAIDRQGGIINYPTIEVKGGEISPVTAIAQVGMPSVVSIINTTTTVYQGWFGGSNTADSQASGSGVILSQEGYIVTNYHVIEDATKLAVTLYDGRTLEADIVGGDQASDLAVIKIDAVEGLQPAKFGDSDALQVGELVVAIGNPLDAQAFAWTVTDGIISGLERTVQKDNQAYKLIQTNAAINAGNSGGALLNSKGELIGINSLKISSNAVEGMGFAIPINNAKPIIEELVEKGYISKPYIGIGGYDLTEAICQQIQTEREKGILVTQLTVDGPAEKAGVKVGDIIYAASGSDISSFEELSEILQESSVGNTFELNIDRNGELLKIGVILGEQGTKVSLKEKVVSSQNNMMTLPFSFGW